MVAPKGDWHLQLLQTHPTIHFRCTVSIKFSLHVPSLYMYPLSILNVTHVIYFDQILYPKVLWVGVQRSLIVHAKVESLGTKLCTTQPNSQYIFNSTAMCTCIAMSAPYFKLSGCVFYTPTIQFDWLAVSIWLMYYRIILQVSASWQVVLLFYWSLLQPMSLQLINYSYFILYIILYVCLFSVLSRAVSWISTKLVYPLHEVYVGFSAYFTLYFI